MRLEDLLRRSALAHPDTVALVDGERRVTYGELEAASDSLAVSLFSHGVQRSDRVAVLMDNGVEPAIALFAILKAGAVAVPVNPALKAEGAAAILADCAPTLILTQDRLMPLCSRAQEAAGGVVPMLAVPAAPEEAAWKIALPPAGIDIDLAMLIYTSGSTGEPKGVMLTHRSMAAAANSIAAYLESRSDDVVLSALPLAFSYGLYQLLVTVQTGGRLVLEKSFAFPHQVLERAAAEGVTTLPLVPTIAALLLNLKDRPALPSLRTITNAGAALGEAQGAELRRMFPQARIFAMYGLTECARATYLDPRDLALRPTSVGRAIPNTEVYVVDAEGRRARPGATGELVVRGPHLMQGYWRRPEASAAVLKPGANPWERVLYTGDLFRADAEGYLHFVGRKDDMLKVRGEKVAPAQVEGAILGCPGVAQAVVVGVADPVLGTALHAIVVASDGQLAARDVLRYCSRALPDHMVPRTVEFRAALPTTASGKVSRRAAATARSEVMR